MVYDLSEYFLETNKTVHKGRFFGEVKFDPSHTGNVGFMFTARDILQNSVSVMQRVSSESDITIGGIFLGTLKLTLLPSVTTGRTASNYWTQAMISLYYEEETGHDGSYSGETGWESVKVGDYYVKDAVFQNGLLYLTAYDGMCLFDQPVEEDVSGKFYDMVNHAVGRAQMLYDISIKNGILDAEFFENFYPNADLTYSIYVENDIRTYRDLLYWIAVSIGGFFWVDRDGYLKAFSYHTDYALKEYPDAAIDYDERVAGSSQIYDFLTSWDGIVIDDLVEETQVMDNNGYTDKLMNLGAVPFFQNLTTQQKYTFKINIGSVVKNDLVVRPYKLNMRSAPIFDVGDKIALRNGDFAPWEDDDGDVISIIHCWSYTKETLTLQAYGARRSTVYTQRTSGGGSSGSGSLVNIDKFAYFHFENQATIVADEQDEFVELGSIDFYANRETEVECIAQLTPTRKGIVIADYYWELDGVDRKAATSTNLNDGQITKPIETLIQYAEVSNPGLHTMRLKVKLTSQDDPTDYFLFPVDGVRMIIKGQGLEHRNIWNGLISLEDEIAKQRPELGHLDVDDSLSITEPNLLEIKPSEVIPAASAPIVNYNQLDDDGVDITIENP